MRADDLLAPAMEAAEFDKFADEYAATHAANIRLSGEDTDFFAGYKVADVLRELGASGCEPETILDLGAGVGNSVPHFRRLFPQTRLICLDVSARSLAVAGKRYPDAADYLLFDGGRMPLPDNGIDVGFAACVFHHIAPEGRARVLDEFMRVLKPGGWLFLFEHNPLNPLTVTAVKSCPFDENAQLLRRRAATSLLAEAGFDGLRYRYRLFFPALLAPLRRMEPCLTRLPLGAQYVVIGRKPAC